MENKKNLIEELEKIAEETQEKYDINTTEELKYLHNLIDIILNNKNIIMDETKTDYVKSSKSIKYAYNFLKNIDKKYGQIFINAYNNGEIQINISKKQNNEEHKIDDLTFFIDKSLLTTFNPSLIYDYAANTKSISMPINNDISDAVALVHEFIHYLTINKDNFDKPGINMFSETPSIASEYLFEKYYPNINGVHKIGNLNLKLIYQHAINGKIKLYLLEQIMEDGYLDFLKFSSKLNGIKENDLKAVIYNILVTRDMFISNTLPYFTGTILSMDSIKDLEELADCIEILKESPISLYQHFDLKLNDNLNELDKNVIERLEENLKIGINNRNKKILTKKFNNK